MLLHYIHERTSICLPFFAHTKSADNQSKAKAMGKESSLNPYTNQNTQAKCPDEATPKLIVPAHKNTPCTLYAGGVMILTAQIGFSDLVTGSQFFAGTTECDLAGFQYIGAICNLQCLIGVLFNQ